MKKSPILCFMLVGNLDCKVHAKADTRQNNNDSNSSKLEQVMRANERTRSDEEFREQFCGQGSVLKRRYSIRSYNGDLCAAKDIASLSIITCFQDRKDKAAAYDNFNKSNCAEKAKKALNAQDYSVIALAQGYLMKEFPNINSNSKRTICQYLSQFPKDVQKLVMGGCK